MHQHPHILNGDAVNTLQCNLRMIDCAAQVLGPLDNQTRPVNAYGLCRQAYRFEIVLVADAIQAARFALPLRVRAPRYAGSFVL
jgi:hypothetical protein